MCCLWFSWSSCVFFCCVLLQTTGTRIENCASGSVEVVADTADFSLTCVEYTGTVQWRYTVSTQPDRFNVIGSCGSSCQLDRDSLSLSFSLTQLSATSSRLGLKSIITSASLPGDFTYFCAASSCSVSIVVHAELSTPTLTVTTPATGSGWTVRGNVDITRIFSSAGQYSCVWEVKRPGSGSYTQIVNKAPTIDPPANTTGHCDFPDRTLSATAGTYTYRVTVSPGQTVKTDSSVVVETPATPSISCSPTGYVSEGGELTCTCSGDVGRPAGRLQLFRESTNTFTHGQFGGNTLQEKLTVSKADNGKKVRCDVDWITDITGADFTIQVAYGPTRADLPDPPVYELHPTQSNNQPLTLTCSAVGVNPGATYSWSRSQCGSTTGSTCSFVPTQGDNGGDISCTAVNTITNVRKTSDTRTLRIHYPPSSPPVITGYSGGVLYAGNAQSMTCTVQGGNPAVSSVTFTCDGGGQQVNGGNSTSKTIQVTASRDNNGRQCTCGANWENKNPPWYTQTASVTLQVYYAPVTPTIEYRQQKYPFLAGESPTLYCTLPSGADSGNPPASLTFKGQTGSAGQREVSVTLPELTSADNGRRVMCQANNAFTTHSNTPVKQYWTLVVYYISQTITALPANTCMMTSPDSNTCQVKEGQRVHVSCSADSNPSPPTVTWQQGSGSSLDFTADRFLPLTYVCDARSSSSGSGDRLPLRRNITLTVLTIFPVRSVQLTLNTQTMLLEVAESQSTDVIFECTADFARPSPHLVLSDDQGREVARLTGGSTDVTGQQSVLTHTMRNVRCENSAVYTCTADNGVGRPVYSTATLRVLCGLRIPSDSFDFQEDGVPVLDGSKGQGELHFQILTTATPHTASFLYLGSDDTGPGSQPTPGLLSVTCSQPSVAYKSSCLLRASNVTQDWTGLYNVTMETENQAVFFIFRLQMQSTCSCGQTSTCNEVPLIVVVAILSVIVVVLLVLNIYQYVMRWRRLPATAEQPTTHKSVDERAARTETPLAMSPIASGVATDDTGPYEEVRSEIRAVSEAPHTSHTSETILPAVKCVPGGNLPEVRQTARGLAISRIRNTKTNLQFYKPGDNLPLLSAKGDSPRSRDTGPYEELKPIDIGLKSVYSAMSPPPHTSGTDGGYENSG
ncbi:uncharacterized protein LOC143277317 [Babylonia areolata]|uniref:uncharacterized protein LOC143277317 n=1 Tax=Babylonia areolata TaxID=304850 RepID=UPI003FD2462E